MRKALLVCLMVLGLTGVAYCDEVYLTRIALRSSVKVADWMNWKTGSKPVYKLAIHLMEGERVVVNGCMNVTNDTGGNVGWGIRLVELITGEDVSPRQTRNVTPDMHHDSNSVVGYFVAPAEADYIFALVIWTGSTSVGGQWLTIDTARFGQVMITVLD